MGQDSRLDLGARRVVALVLVVTGASSIVAQITWQRVIALHSGVDLESSVLVVAAFLGGLGLGSIAGGWVADRLSPTRALLAMALTSLLVAGYALVSIWLLYDLYRDVAGNLDRLVPRLAFNGAILLVPTFLQGMSLPLVARAVTTDAAEAGPQLGRFYAANTLGAAAGAIGGGWALLGIRGFEGAIRIAALGELGAAAVLGGLAFSTRRQYDRRTTALGALSAAALTGVVALVTRDLLGDVEQLRRFATAGGMIAAAVAFLVGLVAFMWPARPVVPAGPVDEVNPVEPLADGAVADGSDPPAPVTAEVHSAVGHGPAPGPAWIWYGAYAMSGAVALGFEQVFFRLIDGVMRPNTYVFAHVLAMYLTLLSIGMAVGSWAKRRVEDHRRAFLWLQFAAGLTAVTALVVFVQVLPSHVLATRFASWFNTDGFAGGFESSSDLFLFGLVLPLFLMAAPVLLAGASFPFVQTLVTRDLATVGHSTGRLAFANLTGNVVGTLITGFVLIDRLGTAGTYRVLVVPLAVAGLVAAALSPRRRLAAAQMAVALVAVIAASLLLPSNDQLWATLHGTDTDAILVAEDRSCASAVELYGDNGLQLTINGAGQNGYPFDDFHILIGLLPSLAHGPADHGLAIGFGIGSTSYAMLASDQVDEVTSIELCGGHYQLVDQLADRGLDEFERLRDDARHDARVGDGRRLLLVSDDEYDLIVPDTVRPNSAGSGNLFSREFQELVSSRLADDGVTAGWIPTYRSLNAVTTTFPYVVSLSVPSYNDSGVYLASRSPLELDRDTMLTRFDALAAAAFTPEQRRTLRAFIAGVEFECVNDGQVSVVDDPTLENRDLYPRDEYFVTNGGIGEEQVARTCG